MKRLVKEDRISTALLLGIGSEVVTALLLYVILLIAGVPAESHYSWFGVCIVPPLLLLRHFAKRKECPKITKTLITVLFFSTVALLFFLIKTNALSL